MRSLDLLQSAMEKIGGFTKCCYLMLESFEVSHFQQWKNALFAWSKLSLTDTFTWPVMQSSHEARGWHGGQCPPAKCSCPPLPTHYFESWSFAILLKVIDWSCLMLIKQWLQKGILQHSRECNCENYSSRKSPDTLCSLYGTIRHLSYYSHSTQWSNHF